MIQKNMPKGMLQVFGRENEGRRMKIWSFTFSQTFPKFWQVLAKWLVLKKVSHGHYSGVYGPISCFGVAKSIKYWKREAGNTYDNFCKPLPNFARSCYLLHFHKPYGMGWRLAYMFAAFQQVHMYLQSFTTNCKILQVLVKYLQALAKFCKSL